MLQRSEVRGSSDGVVFLNGGAEGGAPQRLQAVDKDEGARQVLPAFSDGVLHFVQAHVQLLDHVSVAVADLSGPRDQEVIRRLPHGLQTKGQTLRDLPTLSVPNTVNAPISSLLSFHELGGARGKHRAFHALLLWSNICWKTTEPTRPQTFNMRDS